MFSISQNQAKGYTFKIKGCRPSIKGLLCCQGRYAQSPLVEMLGGP